MAVMLLPPRRRVRWPLLAAPLLLFLILGHHIHMPTYNPARHTDDLVGLDVTAGAHMASPHLATFWRDLLAELDRAEPPVPKFLDLEAPPAKYMDANNNKRPVLDVLVLDDGDVAVFQASHDGFVAAARLLAPRMPYVPGSRGVIMTAGSAYVGVALTSLLMLRRSGSRLPVHLFIDTRDDYDTALCDDFLPTLDVTCLVLADVLGPDARGRVSSYQNKVLAMLFSPFQEVLFLDADAWPIHDPDPLFAAEPYLSRGLVTWPDFWAPTFSPLLHRITRLYGGDGDDDNDNSKDHPSRDDGFDGGVGGDRCVEAGIMLYDKARHADDLLLAAYYNWHGPDRYYTLLSQGAPGEGDKETFLYAARVLRKPFYHVRRPIAVVGRWLNGTFQSSGMKQYDPVEDYALTQSVAAAAAALSSPPPSPLSPPSATRPKDEAPDPDAPGSHPGPPEPRPFWIHHNGWKLDLRTLGAPDAPIFRTDEAGRPARLWGDDPAFREAMSGYDVERALWTTVAAANCASTFLGECARLRWYIATVFGEDDDVGHGEA